MYVTPLSILLLPWDLRVMGVASDVYAQELRAKNYGLAL